MSYRRYSGYSRYPRRGYPSRARAPRRVSEIKELKGSVTTTGDGAYTQEEFDIPVNAAIGLVARIKEIVVELPSDLSSDAADVECLVQWTSKTKAAIVTLDDDDLISKLNLARNFGDATGIGTDISMIKRLAVNKLHVSSKIYCGVDNTTGAASTIYFRIRYQLETIDRTALMDELIEQSFV